MSERVTEIEDLTCIDGLWIARGPKCLLVLTKAELITALRRGKHWQRQRARQQYEQAVAARRQFWDSHDRLGEIS